MILIRPLFVKAALALVLISVAAGEAGEQGRLYVVGMGPAGADLTAPRALSVVERADVILCSPGMPKKFALFGSHIDPAKVAFDPWKGITDEKARKLKQKDPVAWAAEVEKQRKKVQAFIREQISQGRTVVMMDGGDPCIYGPTLNYLLNGFDDRLFEVIPGMSAVNAAGAALRRSLTCDESRFVLLSSFDSLMGKCSSKDDTIIRDLAKYKSTIVLYMSLRSVSDLAKKLKNYYDADVPVAIVFYAGYADKETVLKSTLADIASDLGAAHEQWLGLVIIGECIR